MNRRLRAGLTAWPFTLTFAWTVGVFTASTAALQDLWRPLLLALALTAVVMGSAAVFGRGNRGITLLGGGAWLLALGAWPIAVGLGAVALWRYLVARMRRRRGRPAVREPMVNQVSRAANALGFAGAIVAVVALLGSGAVRFRGTAETEQGIGPAAAATPNVYVVLLDGYPATTTLREEFSFDNRPFTRELSDRGFTVPSASHSNYNRTLLTLTSMLHMKYVDDIEALSEVAESGAAQTRQLTAALNDAPVTNAFRSAGYDVVALGSTYGEATLTSADEVRQSGALTMFEEQFLRYTALGKLLIAWNPELIAEQHRQGVLRTLDGIEKLAGEAQDGHFLALAHIFSPHTPFVFSSDGTPRTVQECYPESCGVTDAELDRLQLSREDYGKRLAGQVQFLNGRLLEVVDTIVADDPAAVIVLFSDHGARFEEGVNDEHFRNFLAARTPGREGLIGDDMSLVNLFPTLLNGYFDTDVPELPYEAWWAPEFSPLEPERVR